MMVVVITHPTFATGAQVQVLKRNVAANVLANVEFELRNNGLAIQGKVQAWHSFEAYRLAKRLVK
jgi:hypothetical protein